MLSSTQGRLIQPSEEGRQPSRQQGKCERQESWVQFWYELTMCPYRRYLTSQGLYFLNRTCWLRPFTATTFYESITKVTNW